MPTARGDCADGCYSDGVCYDEDAGRRRAPLTNGDACCLPPAGTVRVTPRGVYHVCNPFCVDGFRCMHAPVRESHPLTSPTRTCLHETYGNIVASPSVSGVARPQTHRLRFRRSQKLASRAKAVHKSLHCDALRPYGDRPRQIDASGRPTWSAPGRRSDDARRGVGRPRARGFGNIYGHGSFCCRIADAARKGSIGTRTITTPEATFPAALADPSPFLPARFRPPEWPASNVLRALPALVTERPASKNLLSRAPLSNTQHLEIHLIVDATSPAGTSGAALACRPAHPAQRTCPHGTSAISRSPSMHSGHSCVDGVATGGGGAGGGAAAATKKLLSIFWFDRDIHEVTDRQKRKGLDINLLRCQRSGYVIQVEARQEGGERGVQRIRRAGVRRRRGK